MHRPRKRFGQHFLQDKNVIERIVAAIASKPLKHLVEIGPGQGALTFPILKLADHLDVIEFDRDLVTVLRAKENDKLTVYQQDALEFDFAKLAEQSKPLRVFGNLPYNISTPLIFHLLIYSSIILDMIFMLQKEVVERMVAEPGSDSYGRLSVMVQYHCQADRLFDVSPHSFNPPPKVNSSVVCLVPYTILPFQASDYSLFSRLVKQAFSQRRKTLRNSLKEIVNEVDWKELKMDSQLRPEQLTVKDFVELSNYVYLRDR